MHLFDSFPQAYRYVWQSPVRGSLVAIAFCLALTMFTFGFRWRERVTMLHPNQPDYVSSNNKAFFASTRGGTLGQLVLQTSQQSQLIPYDPYPEYNSDAWKSVWRGTYRNCAGADGSPLDHRNPDTGMKGYHWNQSDFPAPVFGSYDVWNLDRSLCTDRYSRYAVYGYTEDADNDKQYGALNKEQWDTVNWADLQTGCLRRNADRYPPSSLRGKTVTLHKEHEKATEEYRAESERLRTDRDNSFPTFNIRTAVVLRTWIDREYTEDDLHFIRSMITELSLLPGGEYEVILLVDAKDTELPHPGDRTSLDGLKKYLPPELRDLTVFFNSEILETWYPKVPAHETILQYFQPMQVFSRLNPQYDFLWQFELDSRYTGHFYPLLQQAAAFAKQQPRENLWERNSYFYIPAVHGSWDNFMDQVNRSIDDDDTIWGPQPPAGIDLGNQTPEWPGPNLDGHARSWGVGEEADVITWLPHFDPTHTSWPWASHVYNFPEKGRTPRRASVVSMSRVSSRLLHLMHMDQSEKGYGLASEMSPISWAFFYGLKAVQVPQPIYHAHEMDPEDLDTRANSGKPGQISAGSESIWGWHKHDDIKQKMSYAYRTEFPEKIYRSWLGYDDDGQVSHHRLCLPPMFLHPVKKTAR